MFYRVISLRSLQVIVGLSLLTSLVAELHARSRAVVRKTLVDGTTAVVVTGQSPRLLVHIVWLRKAEPDHLGHIHAQAWATGCQERADRSALDASFYSVIDDHSVGMTIELPRVSAAEAARAVVGCVFDPVFSTRALDQARRGVLSQLGSAHALPVARLLEAALSRRAQPPSIDQQRSAIHALRVADLHRHHRALVTGSAALAIRGPIHADAWLAVIERMWPARSGRSPEPLAGSARVGAGATSDNRLAAAEQLFVYRDGPNADIALAFRTPSNVGHRQLVAEIVAARIERAQRNGGAGYRVTARAGASAVELYVSCQADRTSAVVAEVAGIVDRLRTEGAARNEIEAAGQRLASRMGSQSLGQRVRQFARAALFDHAVAPDRVTTLSRSASPEAIGRSIIEILDWRRATLLTVSPARTSPSAARRIRGRIHKARRRSQR